MLLSALLAALADGRPHHITELAALVRRPPQQMNALWQQVPQHLRGLLRQQDGFWHLVRPLAILPSDYSAPHFDTAVIQEAGSSNDILLSEARNGKTVHRRMVVVHNQTDGRGRQGRHWESRLGECLTFSLGWVFDQPQAELGALAPVSALACTEALAALGCPAQIKWPNDLVVGSDKLGGILIETVRCDGRTHAVIGIGINYVLPKTIENAASFQAASTQRHTAAALLGALAESLYAALARFAVEGFPPFQAAYTAAHRDQGAEVCLTGSSGTVLRGTVTGVAANGALRLRTESGEEVEAVNGETSLRRPEQSPPAPPADAPPRRYLLLDGGNSRLKWAWVENGRILRTASARYRDLSALDEDWQLHGTGISRITGSAVCGDAKKQLVADILGREIEWLGSMPHALGISNHYRDISEHGADRWFNVLGSRSFSRRACVVVSCGTAVTLDALTADGHYLGGSIMPGFHLMRESLARKTANLKIPEGHAYPFATSTANALASGMSDAVCGALILMHGRLQARVRGEPVDVVITGGGAKKVAAALPAQFALDNAVKIVDNLVIFGLINWIEQ